MEMVSEIAATNEKFLGLMSPKSDMLLEWGSDFDGVEETLMQIKSRSEQLRLELPDDPKKAMETLIQEMLATAIAKRKREASE